MASAICAIVAMDEGRVIGRDNQLPWHLPIDQKYFKEQTRGHTVLMGRKTYESLPDRFRPLPGRLNVVLSKSWTASPHEQVKVIHNLKRYLESVKNGQEALNTDKLWIIGGQQVYTASLPFVDWLYLTRVPGKHAGDAFFPEFESGFKLVSSVPSEGCTFEIYQKV